MEKIKEIKIDYRENQRIKFAKEYYNAPVEETRLDYGDFLFIGNKGTEILFEYKKGQDFLNSIQNNHLHNQTLEACTNYKYQFIIVECYSLHDLSNSYYYDTGIRISAQQINGAIASLNTISTVLFAQKMESAFDLMGRQAMKILEDKPLTWKFTKKSINPALNYLSTVKGLQRQAQIICKELDLHNLQDLFGLTIEDLTSVDGIGKRKAETIIKAIKMEEI